MKPRILVFACLAAMLACASPAQSPTNPPSANSPWIGVWLATLDGQPAVTLTLADDSGSLAGTLVFNIISRNDGPPRVLASEPHVLLNTRVDGGTLSFQARRLNGALMNFTVSLGSNGNAQIHCLDCGTEAPVADLVKAPVKPE